MSPGRLALLALLATPALAGCVGPAEDVAGLLAHSGAPPTPGRELPDAQWGLGWDLLRHAYGSAPGTNVLLSPLSVHTALCMAYEGARGGTRDAMAATLHLPDKAPGALHGPYASLLAHLDRLAGVDLDVANAVWMEESFARSVRPEYLATLDRVYDAEARQADFRDAATLKAINAWAHNATRGMIPSILDTIPRDALMYLLNAVYFKGTWEAPFDPNRTKPGEFQRTDGQVVEAPMMRKAGGNFSLGKGNGFTMAKLPYDGGEAAMLVVLPDPGVAPADLLARLGPRDLSEAAAEAVPARDLVVTLPKFNLSYKQTLNDHLKALGMEVAFSNRANFGGMAEGTKISRVIHATAMEVSEEGTKAAAVTIVEVAPVSVRPLPPTFTVDRPFLVAIVDEALQTPLFLGVVADPSA